MSRKAEIPKFFTHQYLRSANMHGANKKNLPTAPSIEHSVMSATEDVSVPILWTNQIST